MKKVVERERNKAYYRVAHWPIWVWVFWILPGHLTRDLFERGPDQRHWIWLGLVAAVTAWRAFAGRLPGCENAPYVTHWGVAQPNLWYRVVCYTAAWADLLLPFTLNFLGLAVAAATGAWRIHGLYTWLYYPLLALVVLATVLDFTPRARRTTLNEGNERAWFYIAIWTVVPTQVVAWAAWRLVAPLGLAPVDLARLRLAVFCVVAAAFFALGVRNLLPRTAGYAVPQTTLEPQMDTNERG
jgi:hypothetical protein